MGNWIEPYNAVHWDGNKWELRHLKWDDNVSKLNCLFSFNYNDIWYGITNMLLWNGNEFEKKANPVLGEYTDKTINKIWGTSSSDLYVVGNEGKIVHYDGQNWTKLDSPVDVDINDIYGYKDLSTGESVVLCVAGNVYKADQAYILNISNDHSVNWYPWDISDPVSSVWIASPYKKFACGNGIWIQRMTNREWINPGSTFLRRIRGTGHNDIFASGDYAHVLHFNGKSWHDFQFMSSGILEGLDVNDDIVVTCGSDGRKAYIIMAEK